MTARSYQRLTAAETPAWLGAHPDALILDARDARQHDAGHLPGALRLDGRNHERLLLREDRSRPVFVYCYHGHSSQTYAQMFVDFGFTTVADLIGGFAAWPAPGTAATDDVTAPAPTTAPTTAPAGATRLPALVTGWLAGHGLRTLESRDAHGNTPLMRAAWRGERAVVDALLAAGADRHAVNADGNNAIWMGCVSNDPTIVRALAAAGVPLDHANLTGATALMYAASSGKAAIVQALLALGADAGLRTQDDFSALDMAATRACLDLLRPARRAA